MLIKKLIPLMVQIKNKKINCIQTPKEAIVFLDYG